MYTLELGTFMYRYSINVLPSSFTNYFTKRSDIHNYLTRHGNNLNLTKNKKTFFGSFCSYQWPRLWNALENSLKAFKSDKHSRKHFKKKLISNYD